MNKAIFINEKTNTITFKDGRFYEAEDKKGLFFPGATSILQVAPKSAAYYEWLKKFGNASDTIAMDAMEKGSNVHDLTERYDNGEEVSALNERGEISYTKDEWEQFNRYVEFSAQYKPEVLKNEFSMCLSAFGYGGTLDRILRIKDENWLIDIKTGNIYEYYFMQLVAYKKLFEVYFPDIPVHRMGILHLNAKTRGADKKNESIQGQGWCMEEPANWTEDKNAEEYFWKLFQSCKSLWEFQNPSWKPNEKIFALTIKKN